MLRLRLCLIVAALPLLSVPAYAQGAGQNGIASKGFSPIEGVGPKPTQREAAPPGLPGAQPRDTAVAPEVPLDVPPTDALFEAINRGDMALARDSLNRGADLNGRNVLGMTPLDLSIDLSRNDITFLLLSMRSQDSVGGPPTKAAALPAAGKAGRKGLPGSSAQAALDSANPVGANPVGANPVGANPVSKRGKGRVPAEVSAVTAAQTPSVRYASVPAAPVPQAGFLGFGQTSTP